MNPFVITVDERISSSLCKKNQVLLKKHLGELEIKKGACYYYPELFLYFSGEGQCLFRISETDDSPNRSVFFLGIKGAKWEEPIVGDCFGMHLEFLQIKPEERNKQFGMKIAWGGEGQVIQSIAFYGANRSGSASPEEIALWYRNPDTRPAEVHYEYHSIDFMVFELANGRRTFVLVDDPDTLRFELNVETTVAEFIERIGREGMEVQHFIGPITPVS